MTEAESEIIKRLERIEQLVEVHDKAMRLMAHRHLDNTEQLIRAVQLLERMAVGLERLAMREGV